MDCYFMTTPVVLSLTLSNVCCAKCVWCPMGQGLVRQRKNKFIPLAIIDKIVADCREIGINTVIIGDNGEALLHPEFKEVVNRLKAGFPMATFQLVSNFYMMDEDLSRFVIDNFDRVSMNLDGARPETYEAVKRMSFQRVLDNLTRFIGLRERKPVALAVNILTQARYFLEIGEPSRTTVPDDTIAVNRLLMTLLNFPHHDLIYFPLSLTWAERKKRNMVRTCGIPCLAFGTMGLKIFIDTDGDVYSCCQDYDAEIKFGNVLENTISEIWNGEKRARFIDLILKGRFAEIGDPCAHCQD